MDRNINYTVDIKILSGGGQWGVRKLVTFDATYVALPFSLVVEQLP